MLELRPTCEHCNRALPPDATDARICSFECTFPLKSMQVARCCVLVAALFAACGAQADEFRFLGSFHHVVSPDRGEHCDGYSLGLWRHDGRLLGLFDVHAGLCGDPPCATLHHATLDPETGELRFAAVVREERFAFDGRVSDAGVTGLLNGEPVRLAPDDSGVHQENPTDRSFATWCGFWQTVGRCTGVRQLCGAPAAQPD